MRSLVCCDVSTVCARLVRATSAESSAVEMRHNTHAPSLAGCIRIDNPGCDYTAVKLLAMRDFAGVAGLCRRWRAAGFWGMGAVARWVIRKKRRAFPGIWRLKSTRLCTRNPQQATRPERCNAAAKDLSETSKCLREEKNKRPKNEAQQRAPTRPVSANISR